MKLQYVTSLFYMIKKGIFVCITLLLFSCKKEGCTDEFALNYNPEAEINNGSCEYHTTTPYTILTPEGFPNMTIPEDNPNTVEGIALGKKLFNEPLLSADGTQSCASCHFQSANFSDTNQFSSGITGQIGNRNASTIVNAGWNTSNFWDGRVVSLEDQAFEPITNPIEMNNTWINVENTLNANEDYQILFKEAFNIDYIDSTHVVKAIAQFERSLVSSNSKFDKFYRGEISLSPSELNGYAIYNSERGDCFHCHGTLLFTDNLFHNNAIESEEPFSDNGFGDVTYNPSDNGKFKTPSLRNIEYSAPYMHDGRFATLEQVLEHYNSGGHYTSTVDPLMKKIGIGLQLTNQELFDLLAFLKTLSDEDYVSEE